MDNEIKIKSVTFDHVNHSLVIEWDISEKWLRSYWLEPKQEKQEEMIDAIVYAFNTALYRATEVIKNECC